jgi:aryl-alcohol dehydrogenase-like predicted oxidoreductase
MDPDDINCQGLSRHHILHNIEQSLKRLQTSYIDLLYVHMWDEGTPIEETMRALTDLVKAGKVRYLGSSNFTGWQVKYLGKLFSFVVSF